MNTVLISLLQTLQIIINIYIWIIIAAALISWIRPNPYNKIVQLLYALTAPAYNLVRRVIPTTFGMIDIAPMIIILALIIISNLLTSL
ncbi:MAG: YggT family protein [Campylobacteraceae bacterium]|jgi:YggT family protein|nr:YggT family protein [Campylobacteraceae bacterium]